MESLPVRRHPSILIATLLLVTVSASHGQTVLIDESFVGGQPDPASADSLNGSSSVVPFDPDIQPDNFVLQLTPAENRHAGVVRFDVPIDLRAKKVVLEVTTFMWGGSLPPADAQTAVF